MMNMVIMLKTQGQADGLKRRGYIVFLSKIKLKERENIAVAPSGEQIPITVKYLKFIEEPSELYPYVMDSGFPSLGEWLRATGTARHLHKLYIRSMERHPIGTVPLLHSYTCKTELNGYKDV
jgi:hypothetical protein